MNQRGVVYRDPEGKLILLTVNPVVKRVLSQMDDVYDSLPLDKADVVEIQDENELISMTNFRAIRGLTFTGNDDQSVNAHTAIDYALAHRPESLAEMMALASEDG